MRTTSVVVYRVDKQDIRQIEVAIQQEDKEAYAEHGPYFLHHRGKHYLVSEGDVGYKVRALLRRKGNHLGGIEIAGTADELQEYTCLLDSDDCYSCFLGDRLLLVPKPAALASFVRWMGRQARTQRVGDSLLLQALWEIGIHFLSDLQVVGTPEEGYTRIATPFLLPDNDVVDLYYRREEETILLTDLGETLAWLRSQHADPHLPEVVWNWVADICSSLGIEQREGTLSIHVPVTEESVADAVIRLAQGYCR